MQIKLLVNDEWTHKDLAQRLGSIVGGPDARPFPVPGHAEECWALTIANNHWLHRRHAGDKSARSAYEIVFRYEVADRIESLAVFLRTWVCHWPGESVEVVS